MSKKKRSIEKQRKLNSPQRKAKEAKKRYYASQQAKDAWEKKKESRRQSQLSRYGEEDDSDE